MADEEQADARDAGKAEEKANRTREHFREQLREGRLDGRRIVPSRRVLPRPVRAR